MKKKAGLILILVSIALIFFIRREFKEVDTIAIHIGKSYGDVVRDSTFPVKSKTVIRSTEPPVVDSTWISDPVIIQFDDPDYGFILPTTILGAVGYKKNNVSTITTSPMRETVHFNELVALLSQLQNMLRNSGWPPEDEKKHSWLKIENNTERTALQNLLFDQVVVVMLRIPNKYTLALNVKCYARCNDRDTKTARYLIDVSIGQDFHNR